MFIIFAGLPGTGKSTIAQNVADHLKSIYLRIDSIEQAVRSSGILTPEGDMGPAGYMAACRIAADNLRLGHTVIADSVNPIKITRDAYRDVAERLGIGFWRLRSFARTRRYTGRGWRLDVLLSKG